MQVTLTEYEVKKINADGVHFYLEGMVSHESDFVNIRVYFENSLEEKKVFPNAQLLLEGDFIEATSSSPCHLLNTKIVYCTLNGDIPLDNLTIKDKLMATGLIHEFTRIFRKDKIRAMEILKVVGVSEKYAEEILLRNSYILPFV